MKIAGFDLSKAFGEAGVVNNNNLLLNNFLSRTESSFPKSDSNLPFHYLSTTFSGDSSTTSKIGYVVRSGLIINKPIPPMPPNRSGWEIVGQWSG